MRWLTLIVLLLPSVALAFPQTSPPSNYQFYDGNEGVPLASVGTGGGKTEGPLSWADSDFSPLGTARTGWRGICSDGTGSGGGIDAVAMFAWTSCSAPDRTAAYQCVVPDRADRGMGAQQLSFAYYFTDAPTPDASWIVYFGHRKCEDPTATTCNTRVFDFGVNNLRINLNPNRTLSVVAGTLNSLLPISPSPCSTTAVLPTLRFIDIMVQILNNTPDNTHYQVLLRVADTNVTPAFADETITCTVNKSGSNEPSGQQWFGWDKSVGGNAIFRICYDDMQSSQTTVANSSFLRPAKGYPLMTSTTGSSAGMFTAEDATDNDFGGCQGEPSSTVCTSADKMDSIMRVPPISGRYMCSCENCGACTTSATQLETFTNRTSSASENPIVPGSPTTASPYPVSGQGPLIGIMPVLRAAGPGGSAPKLGIGIKDGTIDCPTAGLVMSGATSSTQFNYSYMYTRDDAILPAHGACDPSHNFDCDGSGGNPCPGGATDYVHGIRTQFRRGSNGGANLDGSIVGQVYLDAIYQKWTPEPTSTPTATPLVATNTPTFTRTKTITNTPLFSFTPTHTFTPTVTKTFTRTPTSGLTFTPSPTFQATVNMPSDPPSSVCRTQPCTLCAHYQDDIRIVLAQAKAFAASRCNGKIRVVVDRSYNAVNTPTSATDSTQPVVPISGFSVFSGLDLTFLDPQVVKFTGPGSGVHCEPGETCDDITFTGGKWDAGGIASDQPVFDFYAIPNLTLRNMTITGTTQTGVIFGGGTAKNVVLSGITFDGPSTFTPYSDAGSDSPRLEKIVWNKPTPTVTP